MTDDTADDRHRSDDTDRTPLQRVTLGEAPADLVCRGGEVLLPDGSVEARDVAVLDERIAALPAEADPVVGEDTTVVDASGTVAVPGFVDAHTHLDNVAAPGRAYHCSLAGGTTAVVSEVTGFGPLLGARGVETFLDATADLPLSVFAAVPPQPLVDTFGEPWADDAEREALADLLARERVVGVGEVDWIHLVGRSSAVDSLVERAHREGKVGVGADERDMHRAVERVVDRGGGWAVVVDGEVRASLACPVAACIADRPLEAVADDLDAVEAAVREQGVDADQPIIAVATLTFFGVPALKFTPRGYADILDRQVVGLTPER